MAEDFVKGDISGRSVAHDLRAIVEAYNREMSPVVQEMRRVVNRLSRRIDGLGAGSILSPCACATVGDETLSGLPTLDGYAVQIGDRVLAWEQLDAKENGIYIASVGAWARANDLEVSAEGGSSTMVLNGTINQHRLFVLTSDAVIGADDVFFERVAGGSALIFDSDISAAANIAVSKLAPGTNGYILTTTAGVAAWAAAAAAGDVPTEFVHPFNGDLRQPPSSSSSFQDCEAEPASTPMPMRTFFDASLYPASLGALSRNIYLEMVIAGSAAAGIQVQLRNVTDSEMVTSTDQTQGSTTVTRYLKGPLTVGASSGNVKAAIKEYRVQGRQTTGTTSFAKVYLANFIIRYV